MKRVLVVEDSLTSSLLMQRLIQDSADLALAGAVASGEETLRFLEREQPDVISMDVGLPGINGFETIRRILQRYPIPIVVVTALADHDAAAASFEAIAAGALTLIPKPVGPSHPDHRASANLFTRTLRNMADVPVITRRIYTPYMQDNLSASDSANLYQNCVSASSARHSSTSSNGRNYRLLLIGASTGGPPVIQEILAALPFGFAGAVVVSQHISRGFEDSLADWLGQTCKLPLSIGRNGEHPRPGTVTLTPPGCPCCFHPDGSLFVPTSAKEDISGTIDVLFQSAAKYFGQETVAVLLTGMGRDGAQGLLELKQAGAATISQNEATCLVFGMPAEAEHLGASKWVLPPLAIIEKIHHLFAS